MKGSRFSEPYFVCAASHRKVFSYVRHHVAVIRKCLAVAGRLEETQNLWIIIGARRLLIVVRVKKLVRKDWRVRIVSSGHDDHVPTAIPRNARPRDGRVGQGNRVDHDWHRAKEVQRALVEAHVSDDIELSPQRL